MVTKTRHNPNGRITPVPDLSDLYTVTPNGNAGGAYGAARRRPHFPMEHASRFYFQELFLPT